MILVEDADVDTHGQDAAPLHHHAPPPLRRRAPIEAIVLDDDGALPAGAPAPPPDAHAPGERWQFLPIWAQEPTVTQVSTMVPLVDPRADIDEGGHQDHPRRDNRAEVAHHIARHTARKTRPHEKRFSPQPANFSGTLS